MRSYLSLYFFVMLLIWLLATPQERGEIIHGLTDIEYVEASQPNSESE